MAITASDDGSMCLWSLDRCECKEQWLSNKHGQQTCLAADWENDRAVSGTAQGKLCLWDSRFHLSHDTKRLALLHTVHAHPGARINKVLIDVVIGLAITAAEDGKLRTWDVTLPELTCVGTFDKHNEAVTAVVVNFDKNRVLSGADDGSLHLWHLGRSSNASKNRTSIGMLSGHTDKINNIAMDLQKAVAVTVSDDETARVWDIQNFTSLGVLEVTCLRGNWKKKLVLSASDVRPRVANVDNFSCCGRKPGLHAEVVGS
eukprot:g23921.t1